MHLIGKLLVVTMLAYVGLQVAYNLGIKRIIVVDVVRESLADD